jgi:ribosomal protein S18 acetylase RimI-like enzyme
MPVYPGALQ